MNSVHSINDNLTDKANNTQKSIEPIFKNIMQKDSNKVYAPDKYGLKYTHICYNILYNK